VIATKFLHYKLKKLGQLSSTAKKTVRAFHVLKLGSALFTQFASLSLVYVLTPTEYGQFALIASVAQLMYILTSGWSNGSIINLGSQSFARTGSYKAVVYYRAFIVLVTLVAVTLVFVALKPFIEGYMKIDGMFPYVLILYLGYIFYDHASQLLYPGNHDQVQAGAEFSASLVLLLVVVFAVHNLNDYILAFTLVSAVFAYVVSFLFLRYFREHVFKWNRTEFKSVLNYSAWQIISVVSIYIINMGANYFLVICHVPLEQIGFYNLAYRFYSGFAPFFMLFGILIPKWIHSKGDDIHSVGNKILKIIFALAMLYLLLGFGLTPLLKMFDMQRYLISADYFIWLFPAFLLTSYTNLINAVIANTQRFRSAQTGILVQSGVLVLFSFPMVSVYGVPGLIAAITASSAIGAVYFNWFYRKVITPMEC
jgi:O-antigen/teichoic acid export membrane protein